MNLPKIAIQHNKFILIIIIIALLVGVRSFVNMPRAEDPQVNIPLFTIIIAYPGTSTEDMEHLIVDPLEKVLDELDDIREIKTAINEGVVNMAIKASFDIDAKEKYDEILREVAKVRAELPNDIAFFDIFHYKPADQTAAYQYALTAESNSYAQLLEFGEAFEKELKKIKGIKKVDLEGYPEEEVRISLDFQRMSALKISLQELINILSSNNINLPGGAVSAQNRSLSISTTGAYQSLKEIRETVIASSGDQLVYLDEIADVEIDYEDKRWIARFNQENALWLTIKIKEDANILQVAEQIKSTEQTFKNELPLSIDLHTAFEQPSAVKLKIDDFTINLLQGMVLVGAIIFLFIGWRAAVIIITIIPLSILIGLAMLNGSGFALQQVSIAGLILALGLLVDNGIVVIESIDGYLKEGYSKIDAAINGTKDVGFAIISSTATTILAFFPLSQLGYEAGAFVKSLPITVILTLFISLILALVLSPILASKIMKPSKAKQAGLVDRFMDWLRIRVYRPALEFCLRFSWIVIGLSIVLLVFSFNLFSSIGLSLFPPADKPMVLIDIEMPTGTNIKSTDDVVQYVEQVLDTISYVKNYSANTGHGNPRIYYNRPPVDFESNKGQVLVNFKAWNQVEFYNTLHQLRMAFNDYAGAKITLNELKNGAGTPPIEFLVIGENIDTLKVLAAKVATILTATPEVINVDNPLGMDRTGLEVKLNKEKAGLIQLSHLNFDQTIRASLAGLSIGEVSFENDKDYAMVLRIPFEEEPSISDLNKVYLTTSNGSQVPLRQVADIHFKSISPEILHLNLERYTRVKGDAVDSDQTIALTQQINEQLADIPLPSGYSIIAQGEYAKQQELFGDLGMIFLLVLLGIFAILILQFRSILQPIAVFSAIPFAITGSFLSLYLTGWSFSFLAFVGFISLSGIVVNDSILIVDQINKFRAEKMDRLTAIKLGSERRFLPVILTTLTTIMGLLPLAISKSNLWSPVCATLIGGMLSSTFMILLLVPVLYKWFTTFDKEKI